MQGTIVKCCTTDGVTLHGLLTETPKSDEAWIVLHGVNSNFYSSTLLGDISEGLQSTGFTTLVPNTRGHDSAYVNTDPVPMRLGSQFETLHHCLYDIDAWIEELQKRGFQNVSIAGHSLGAIKCLYYVSQRPSKIKRWIAISPPRLNTGLLAADTNRGEIFSQHLRDAVELCGASNPDYLMKVKFPMPMWISASTYVDKYGSKDRYDYLRLSQNLSNRGLWIFGGNETTGSSINFHRADQIVQGWIQSHSLKQSVCTIDGADHSYRGRREPLCATISDWLFGLDE